MPKQLMVTFISIAILLMGAMSVQAGFAELDSASASTDCDIVSGSWSHTFGDFTWVNIYAEGGGPPIYSQRFGSSSGSFSFDLSPDLANGESIEVEIEVFGSRLSISKDIFYKQISAIEGLPPPIARSRFMVTCNTTSEEVVMAIPIEEEEAGFMLLCDDGRLTYTLCDPLVVYNVVSDDGIGLIMYTSNRDNDDIPQFQLYIPAETFDALPANPTQNCTIASSDDGSVVVHLLTSSEIQIDAGPDEEGKVFSYILADLVNPPTSIASYISGNTPEILPSC